MQNEEGAKKTANAFCNGCNSDNMPETNTEGWYHDANNMRDENAIAASKKALSKINGETLLYPAPAFAGIWECIYTCSVNDHAIDCWVENTGVGNPLIRIDGIVVCQSAGLGWDRNHPLQGDTNNSCIGGEFFVTDFKQPIFIFNVQDMIDQLALNSGLYFALFNPSIYQVSLKYSLDHPVFVGLEWIGGNGGVNVGKYTYSIRLVDVSGNRTNWSVQTPLIPVVKYGGAASPAYYMSETYGETPLTNTPYGIRIRFRVNNLNNYSYVEIRRVAHNIGAQIGFAPTPQVYKFVVDANQSPVDIIANPIAVWDFIDRALITWIDLVDDVASDVIQGSFVCKTLRYYSNRLVPMNIKYPTKDITDVADDIFIDDGDLGFPVIESIGLQGHKDPYRQVYFKNNQSGEIEGYGCEFFDTYGVRGFVLPYTTTASGIGGYGLNSVQMPNRRDPMTGKSLKYSHSEWRGAVKAADVANQEARTFERFSLGDYNADGYNKTDNTTKIHIGTSNYNPFAPKKMGDTVNNLTIRINTGVEVGGTMKPYDPYGFDPRYFSQGFGFNGIDTAKLYSSASWATAFSIVKKKRANRVILQGIGVYRCGILQGSKSLDTLNFFSPDLAAAYSPKIADFIANPKNYKVQLVSPLGFFSEMWQADNIGNYDRSVDLISYARLIYNSPNINNDLSDNPVNHGGLDDFDYYTLFGNWRNDYGGIANGMPTNSPFCLPTGNPDTEKGNTIFDIADFTPFDEGRQTTVNGNPLYSLKLSTNNVSNTVYSYWSTLGHNHHINDPAIQNWHEPFYIVNIIDVGASYVTNNINVYEETGHFQKIESIIGEANKTAQTLKLVDERWEDCIPNPFINGVAQATSTYNRYCYIDGNAWINVTYKTQGEKDTILTNLQNSANGHYPQADIDINGNVIFVEVYGVYKNDNIPFTVNTFNLWYSKFQNAVGSLQIDDKYFLPQEGYITVKYDARSPIKVFAGDTFIGETAFANLDRQCDNDGNDTISPYQYQFYNPLPYHKFQINSNIDLPKNASSWVDPLQNEHELRVGKIRQWVIMFACESIINIPYFYNINSIIGDGVQAGNGTGTYSPGQSFPLINYVQRPMDWDTTFVNNFDGTGGGQIALAYDLTDFPNECYWWGYGGFKTAQQFNIDYSKYLNDNNNTQMPLVGFVEKTEFCSRIIWSNERAINEQDDPNLKSFPVLNVFDIMDRQQEIKYAYDNLSEKGNNLFAITGKGVCLLVTEKTIISDLNLSEIALIQPETGFIKGEYWLNKKVGSNDEMWRGIAEDINKCFIPNNLSIYELSGVELIDIGRKSKGSYYSKLYPALQSVTSGYTSPVCAVYDEKHEEYWLRLGKRIKVFSSLVAVNLREIGNPYYQQVDVDDCIEVYNSGINPLVVYLPITWATGESFVISNTGTLVIYLSGTDKTQITLAPGEITELIKSTISFGWVKGSYDRTKYSKVFVYSDREEKLSWQGMYDYSFDKFLNVRKIGSNNDDRVLGLRNLQTWKLNSGYLINGLAINGYVILPVMAEPGLTKELINILINSSAKPIRVEFAEDNPNSLPLCYLDSSISTLYLKNYRSGYYNQVPRKSGTVIGPNRYRLQSDVFYVKIIHNTQGQFILKQVIFGYKLLT